MSQRYTSETFNDELVLAVAEAVDQTGWSTDAHDVGAFIAEHFRMFYSDTWVKEALKEAWRKDLIYGTCSNGTRWVFWSKTAYRVDRTVTG